MSLKDLIKSVPYFSNLVIVGLLVTVFKLISWIAVFSDWDYSLVVALLFDLASVATLALGILFIIISMFGVSIGQIGDDYEEEEEEDEEVNV